MKRNIMPEVWGLLGFACMVWSLFVPSPRGNFLCVMGMLGTMHGAILGIRREIDRWRSM